MGSPSAEWHGSVIIASPHLGIYSEAGLREQLFAAAGQRQQRIVKVIL